MQCLRGIALIPSFLIFGAKHQTPHLCPGNGTGTHHAGFHCDIESTFIQIFAAKSCSGSGNGLHLGMGGDIRQSLRQIMGTSYDTVLAHHNCTYGNFSPFTGLMGFQKRLLHIIAIVQRHPL